MPFIVDVPLQDGKFTARVHSRPSGQQVQQIARDARRRSKEEQLELVVFDNLLTMCEGWDVTDEEDHPIPWSRDGLMAAPWDIIDELSDRAAEFLNRGKSIDAQLKEVAERMSDDDPRKAQLLLMVDEGN